MTVGLFVLFKLLLLASIVRLKLLLTNRTRTNPFQPFKNTLLMEHMLTLKLNDLLILLKLTVANRTKIRLLVFLMILHFGQSAQFLLIQPRILIRVHPSGQHLNQLNESTRIWAVWSDYHLRSAVVRCVLKYLHWWTHELLLERVSWLPLSTTAEKWMVEDVHQRAWAVQVPVSWLEKHWHQVLVLLLVMILLRTVPSHLVSLLISLIALNVQWIFLANLHMVIHQRVRVPGTTKVALNLPMLTLTWMRI